MLTLAIATLHFTSADPGSCVADSDFTTLVPIKMVRLGKAATAAQVYMHAANNTPVILENGAMEHSGLRKGLRKFVERRKITAKGRGRFFERIRTGERGYLAKLGWPWKDSIDWSLNFVFGGIPGMQVKGEDANEETDCLNIETTLASYLHGETQQVRGMHIDSHFELLAAAQVVGQKRWHIVAPAPRATAFDTGELAGYFEASTVTVPPNLAVPLAIQKSSRLYQDDVVEGEVLLWPGWLPHGTSAIVDGSLSVNGRLHLKAKGGDADALNQILCSGSIAPMIRDNEESCCMYLQRIGRWSPVCDF
jgi:hypothetical protein